MTVGGIIGRIEGADVVVGSRVGMLVDIGDGKMEGVELVEG